MRCEIPWIPRLTFSNALAEVGGGADPSSRPPLTDAMAEAALALTSSRPPPPTTDLALTSVNVLLDWLTTSAFLSCSLRQSASVLAAFSDASSEAFCFSISEATRCRSRECSLLSSSNLLLSGDCKL